MITCRPEIEDARLGALYSYDVLDTPPEQSFDRVTRLAKMALAAPIALITLVDKDRVWIKSRQGVEDEQTSRRDAFCAYTIASDQPFIVRNMLQDERFSDNPLVTGEPNVRFYAGIPLRTPGGFNIGALCVIDKEPRDVTQDQIELLQDLARIVVDELELRNLASTDSLTGALTARSFYKAAAKEITRARRYGRALSCIMFDADHFKSVNDTYGHAAGDLVLSNIVNACQAELRPTDVIGRMGGEEFAILLPETGPDGAAQIAERLKSRIATVNVPDGKFGIRVTVSLGVACWTKTDSAVNSVLARADVALYRAKKLGRNRVEYWTPELQLTSGTAA